MAVPIGLRQKVEEVYMFLEGLEERKANQVMEVFDVFCKVRVEQLEKLDSSNRA